ncbi:MAG: hypothetical protein ACREKL_13460, partial [Chthoniobacterales bacterium]
PVESSGNVNSAALMNTLAAAVKNDPDNPRQISFLNVPRAKAHKNGAEADKASVYNSAYLDSWAKDYEIRIDNEGGAKSYDGEVEGPNGTVRASAIVWSKGNPQNTAAVSNPATWIKSWE